MVYLFMKGEGGRTPTSDQREKTVILRLGREKEELTSSKKEQEENFSFCRRTITISGKKFIQEGSAISLR